MKGSPGTVVVWPRSPPGRRGEALLGAASLLRESWEVPPHEPPRPARPLSLQSLWTRPALSVGVACERRGPAGLARENRVTRHK